MFGKMIMTFCVAYDLRTYKVDYSAKISNKDWTLDDTVNSAKMSQHQSVVTY
jgi:hypothetical protein